MRLRTAVRFAGWWWVLPLTLVLAYVFVLAAYPADAGYPLATQIVGNQAMALIAPVTSMAAAWSAARLRRAGYGRPPSRRHWLRVRAELMAPPVGLSLVAVFAGGLAAARPNHSIGLPDPRLAAIAFLTLAAAAALGDTLGSRWPMRLAAPASVIIPYVIIAFPPAMEPLWLRHMVGVTNNCCFVYDTVSTRVVVACCLTYAGFILLALLCAPRPATRPSRRTATAGATLTALAMLAGAGWSVSALQALPTQSRAGHPRCRGAAPAICAWPDHEPAAAALRPLAQRVRATAAREGISVRATVRGWPRAMPKGRTAPHHGVRGSPDRNGRRR